MATNNLKESFKYISFYMLKQVTTLVSRQNQKATNRKVPEAGVR